MLAGRADLWSLRLRGGAAGEAVRVVAGAAPVALVDTTTFTGSVPRLDAPRDLRAWLIGALLAALAAGLVAAVTVRAWRTGSDGRVREDHRRGAPARRLRPRRRPGSLRVADPRSRR